MADIVFIGQFIASKAGKTGLSPTVDVDRYTISDGSRTALVTGVSATEGRRGLYHYRLASADLSLYQYVATFITADATVDQQEIAAIGLVVPDALVSSRLAPSTAGRTLEVAATGEASANVTYWKGAAAPAMTGDAYARLGSPAGASVSADVAAVKSETANIVADTNELQTDWANGGRLDLLLDSAAAGGDPWVVELEGSYTAGDLLRIALAVLAGKSAGSGSSAVTFTGLDGTTERVVATVDASGNRTDMALDGAE